MTVPGADSFLTISAASSASFSQVSIFANLFPWIHQDYHYAQIGQTLFKIKLVRKKQRLHSFPFTSQKSAKWLNFKI